MPQGEAREDLRIDHAGISDGTGGLSDEFDDAPLRTMRPGHWAINELTRDWSGAAGAAKTEGRKHPQTRMVAGDGIEPPTRGFSIPCSTN